MNYTLAVRECLASHHEHFDTDGVNALAELLRFPRSLHKSVASRMPGYQRDVCLNAIGYAEQECCA